VLPEGAAGQAGLTTLPAYLAQLDRGTLPPGDRNPKEAREALVAACYFWTRQMDTYLASLESSVLPSPAQENQLRSDVMSAEATLFRALGDFDGQSEPVGPDGDPADPSLNRIHALRDACKHFLEAEARRTRTSLAFRRGLAQISEFEGITMVAAEAEQAMRRALRAVEMGDG